MVHPVERADLSTRIGRLPACVGVRFKRLRLALYFVFLQCPATLSRRPVSEELHREWLVGSSSPSSMHYKLFYKGAGKADGKYRWAPTLLRSLEGSLIAMIGSTSALTLCLEDETEQRLEEYAFVESMFALSASELGNRRFMGHGKCLTGMCPCKAGVAK